MKVEELYETDAQFPNPRPFGHLEFRLPPPQFLRLHLCGLRPRSLSPLFDCTRPSVCFYNWFDVPMGLLGHGG